MSDDFDVVKRMKYADRQLLVAEDFQREQDYHRNRRWQHNRMLHNYGIVKNELKVEQLSDKRISISYGHAIDCKGREIIQPEEQYIFTIDENDKRTGIFYLTIAYVEKTDPQDLVREAGFTGYTRTWEKAEIELIEANHGDIYIENNVVMEDGFDTSSYRLLLALVDLNGGCATVYPEPKSRRTAGTRLGNIISDDLPDGCITHSKLAINAVEAENIKDGQVGHSKLAANAVEGNNIVDGVVTLAKIKKEIAVNDTVVLDKLRPNNNYIFKLDPVNVQSFYLVSVSLRGVTDASIYSNDTTITWSIKMKPFYDGGLKPSVWKYLEINDSLNAPDKVFMDVLVYRLTLE